MTSDRSLSDRRTSASCAGREAAGDPHHSDPAEASGDGSALSQGRSEPLLSRNRLACTGDGLARGADALFRRLRIDPIGVLRHAGASQFDPWIRNRSAMAWSSGVLSPAREVCPRTGVVRSRLLTTRAAYLWLRMG